MSTPRTQCPVLIYDIVVRIMELHRARNDYGLLSRCALVNWEWNRAASRVLYERVVVAPRFKPVLNLRDKGTVPDSSNFTSACLPGNAPYVLWLEISGYVSARPPPRNTLSEAVSNALKSFVNLCSVQFTPVTYHADLFTLPLSLLLNIRALTSLTVNGSCSDDAHAPQLVQIPNLRLLTLVSPGRAILQLLPDWLARLAGTLTELHLKDNCGSVTPGVLKALVPHIKDTVTAFTLGLSYSLTDGDVCAFLDSLARLRRVHLRYYWQMRRPPRPPALRSLRAFSATHATMVHAREVADFDAWVRRAVGGAPALQELRVHREPAGEWAHPRAHDGLLDHVVRKHAGALRVLDLGAAGVSVRQLREVLERCVGLEEMRVGVDKSALDVFAENSAHLKRLRLVAFQISNTPKSWKEEQFEVKARRMISGGPPLLRSVQINDMCWEAFWTSTSSAHAKLVVQRAEVLMPPWRRTTDE